MSLKKLGRYELVRVLGKGAMGIVYEGRDPNLDRRVAIKTVKVENLSHEAAVEYEARFRVEARSAARLQHPNIVSVYDSDRDGDMAFLVMEFIQGKDLKEHMESGTRYTVEETFRIMRDLLAALDYAHLHGVVHRDIKPANLIIEPAGRVKLGDFGIARMQDSGEATRTQGGLIGTPKYMSPEQTQGLKVDGRSDLFSAGVVLYQLLTGHSPFDGSNLFTIVQQIVSAQPLPPSRLNAALPEEMDAVVARALAKDRELRFANAAEFAMALQTASGFAGDASLTLPTYRFGQAGASSLGTSPAMATTGSATASVAQELEMLYWKELTASATQQDIAGFLARFPDGVYADLAQGRLRRLAGVATGFPAPVASTPTDDPDPQATRLPTQPVRVSAGPAQPAARSRHAFVLWGALGALALAAAVAAWWMNARSNPSSRQLESPVATPAVPASPVPIPVVTVPAEPPAAVPEKPAAPVAALTGAQSLQEIFALRDAARQVGVAVNKDSLRIGKDALGFTVTADRAGYVYVALASSDNKTLHLLFPNELDGNNRVVAGKPMQLPRPNWRVVAAGPPGTNSLLVVVTDGPRDVKALAASRDGPFMVSLNDANGRAGMGEFLSTMPTQGAAACQNPGPHGPTTCPQPFGAAMFSVREVP